MEGGGEETKEDLKCLVSGGKVRTRMLREEETGGTKSQTKNISNFVSDLRVMRLCDYEGRKDMNMTFEGGSVRRA